DGWALETLGPAGALEPALHECVRYVFVDLHGSSAQSRVWGPQRSTWCSRRDAVWLDLRRRTIVLYAAAEKATKQPRAGPRRHTGPLDETAWRDVPVRHVRQGRAVSLGGFNAPAECQ